METVLHQAVVAVRRSGAATRHLTFAPMSNRREQEKECVRISLDYLAFSHKRISHASPPET